MLKYAAHILRRICRFTIPFYVGAVLVVVLAFEHAAHLYTHRIPRPATPLDGPFAVGCLEPDVNNPRANATIVMLARNNELDGAVRSIVSLEKQFNRWFHYPIVFLNDQPWEERFVSSLTEVASGEVQFEVISDKSGMWGFPDWIDEGKAMASIASQGAHGIKYGGLESYHHMCRFNAGYVRSFAKSHSTNQRSQEVFRPRSIEAI